MKELCVLLLSACCCAVIACSLGDRVEVTLDGKPVDIDHCLAPIVKALNDAGIKTISSCCGHGETNGYILLEDRLLIVTPQTNRAAVQQLYLQNFEGMARENETRRRAQESKKK